MSYVSPLTAPMIYTPLTQGATWLGDIAGKALSGLDSFVQRTTPTLASTHHARMGAEILPPKHQVSRTEMADGIEIPSIFDSTGTSQLETGPLAQKPPHGNGNGVDSMDFYNTANAVMGQFVRLGIHAVAGSFMYLGRKHLMGSVFFRGTQPEAFEGKLGNPFADMTQPENPYDWRTLGALEIGFAYFPWLISNLVTEQFAEIADKKNEADYAQGLITKAKYLIRKKIFHWEKKSSRFMALDTLLFSATYTYMCVPNHDEFLGMLFLIITQFANVVAHGNMLYRNYLVHKEHIREEKETGKANSSARFAFINQSLSMSAFLLISSCLLYKAGIETRGLETVNDILMNATTYGKLVAPLFLFKIFGPIYGLVKGGKLLIKPKDPTENPNANIPALSTTTQRGIGTLAIAASLLLGSAALLVDPKHYYTPLLKLTATALFFTGSMVEYGPLIFSKQTWQGGFSAGIKRMAKIKAARKKSEPPEQPLETENK